MNGKFILTSLLVVITTFSLRSQAISNAGFENWSILNYYASPDQYTTTNPVVFLSTGQPNVTKTTDAHSGSFAIKLQSVSTQEGPVFGAAFIGNPDQMNISGGMPFSQRPDSITGWAKYDLQPGDSAYIGVLFKKFGAPLGLYTFGFSGSQNQYHFFTAPVEWFVPIISPDSIVVILLSSSFDNTPVPGSMIMFDDISFVGIGASFPNGDFENWTDLFSEEPDEWSSTNLLNLAGGQLGVSKSADSHSGSFAAKLESVQSISGDSVCVLTNGKFTGSDAPTGGMPVSEIPDKVTGYYKYDPVGPDTALAGLWLYHYDQTSGTTQMLEEQFVKLPPAAEYTYFELPSYYFSLPFPDTVNISFGPSDYETGTYIGLGSTLLVDDLEITYKTWIAGVDDEDAGNLKVYPNPASGKAYIETEENFSGDTKVIIRNISGQTLSTPVIIDGKRSRIEIDVSNLTQGIYFCEIQNSGKAYYGKFIVE